MRCRASALCNMRQVRTLAPLGRASDLTLRQTMAGSDQRAASTRIRVSSLSVLLHLSHAASSRRHPTEPQCSYDPVEGLPLAADADPIDKIRELEEQVGVSIYLILSMFDCSSPCSYTHEETEVTKGKRISFPFCISQSSSPSF